MTLRTWLADRLIGWCAVNATAWPSQHGVHAVLLDELRDLAEQLQRAVEERDELRRELGLDAFGPYAKKSRPRGRL